MLAPAHLPKMGSLSLHVHWPGSQKLGDMVMCVGNIHTMKYTVISHLAALQNEITGYFKPFSVSTNSDRQLIF